MTNVMMNGLVKTLSVATLLVSATAFGGTKDSGADEYLPQGSVKCSIQSEDATPVLFVSGLNTNGKSLKAQLSIPRSFTEMETVTGGCKNMKGAVETAVVCTLQTSTGKVQVRVVSPGDSSLKANIASLDEDGNIEEGMWLPCKRGQHQPRGKN